MDFKCYCDACPVILHKDCPLEALRDKTIVFIGYGNQGRAQALNLVSAEQHRDAAALLIHFYMLSPTTLDGATY